MVTVASDVHAKTIDDPQFAFHRQRETGTIVLGITDATTTAGVRIYLDDDTHAQLLAALAGIPEVR